MVKEIKLLGLEDAKKLFKNKLPVVTEDKLSVPILSLFPGKSGQSCPIDLTVSVGRLRKSRYWGYLYTDAIKETIEYLSNPKNISQRIRKKIFPRIVAIAVVSKKYLAENEMLMPTGGLDGGHKYGALRLDLEDNAVYLLTPAGKRFLEGTDLTLNEGESEENYPKFVEGVGIFLGRLYSTLHTYTHPDPDRHLLMHLIHFGDLHELKLVDLWHKKICIEPIDRKDLEKTIVRSSSWILLSLSKGLDYVDSLLDNLFSNLHKKYQKGLDQEKIKRSVDEKVSKSWRLYTSYVKRLRT